MPDNVPAPQGPLKPTPAPASKKGPGGKVVVMLSSVAKPAPGSAPPPVTTAAPLAAPKMQAAGPVNPATLTGPISPAPSARAKPPPIPVQIPKPVIKAPAPAVAAPAPAVQAPASAPAIQAPAVISKAPAPAAAEGKAPGAKRSAPIKLNLPTPPATPAEDSIFLSDEPEPPVEAPAGWKELEPGELLALKGDLQSLEVFGRTDKPSEPMAHAPASPPKVEEKTATPTPPIAAKVPEPPPPVVTKAPETPPIVAKAPEVSPSSIPAKPLVHLPPIVAPPPPTVLAPVVVISSPSSAKPAANPPALPPLMPTSLTAPLPTPVKVPEKAPEKPEIPALPTDPAPTEATTRPAVAPEPGPPPIVEVKSPAPIEPSTIHTIPPLLKTEAPALAEVKLPPPLEPAIILSAPPPLAPEPGVPVEAKLPGSAEPAPVYTAPPLLKAQPVPPVEAKLLQPVEPGHVPTVPPLLTAETVPPTEAKLPQPVEPAHVHTAPPLLRSEPVPPVEAKLPQPLLPEPAPDAPAAPKPDAPSARKLPPPLPAKLPKIETIVTPPPIDRPKPPPLPAPASVTLPTPVIERGTGPAPAAPIVPTLVEAKAAPPPPVQPLVEDKAATPPPVPPPVEAKVLPPPVIESEKKPQAPAAPSLVTPAAGAKPEAKASAVTGPILSREVKPALRPPVLPARLAREKESEKTGTSSEETLASAVAAAAIAGVIEARTSEPEKLKPPVKPEDKSALPVAPPPLEAKAPEPKLKPPVLPDDQSAVAKATPAAPTATPADSGLVFKRLVPEIAPEVGPVVPAESRKTRLPPKSSAKARSAPAKAPDVEKKAVPAEPPVPIDPALTPRAARMRKRRIASLITFYVFLIATGAALYFGATYISHETRIEGQVIPPVGMLVGDEAWIVTDFRDEVAREAEDLADKRTPALQDIQEKLNHVQRAQADIAAREERIRLLQGQIQAAKDETEQVIKQTKDAAQALWDGPGAQIDQDYDDHQQQLSQTISDRAKALKLNYQPDPNFNSPEVWANAYRLALYQAPTGVDSSKELVWLDTQMQQWRDFTKSVDDRKEKIREQVAAVKQSPAGKIGDLQAQIDDLQHRIDSTLSEETPIKTELQQAQDDLSQSQGTVSQLDPYYNAQLYSIPESKIIMRLPIAANGRFSWRNVEHDNPFSEGETAHSFWLFTRAVRPDGRQYWALNRITVAKDSTLQIVIEPEAFVSTKAILRPDLSPDEQAQ